MLSDFLCRIYFLKGLFGGYFACSCPLFERKTGDPCQAFPEGKDRRSGKTKILIRMSGNPGSTCTTTQLKANWIR
jgi:hypothetical protein